MQITILGGGGFLGQKLAKRLAKEGRLGDRAITGLTLFDLHAPPVPMASFPVRSLGGDVADPAQVAAAIPPGTAAVVHLAAVVSAQAEADFDLGMRVNIQGTLAVLAACRALPKPPRVVFTSSVASFGGGQEARLEDDARQLPGNSYGAQKAIGELLLQDASRKGFLDAVNIRLPTVIVRPGRPNKAASSFVSAILREPLLGLETELPVPEDFAVWICSPRRAVEWFLHALAMDTAPLGLDRGINPPGRSATVGKMLSALETVAGPAARKLVKHVPDPAIEAIVGGWPASFTAQRARRVLGFSEQESLEEIIQGFIEDDLAATRAERGL
ncbi:NAD-dependent epimerase/dehydratase family protein [Siccirubricoccus sp. KC 17139]|uniref:NAD-dependent epimerase/dehydratase family protein n=1 Tax=Siccirubricoccus soli TaxID=2899147 RepID=A0ABT1CZ23_9PROT|nr:D-erythronate dehydrogenase [Siccirubricoccus soli]MCO6414926.1 NAD-dependent epimerase/dehydratase family protein [Siccirubricoccus soli]MCP2681056.1 NAD-dependent epimerase/dehydratase family protein [Siccirubricoccus soli]